MDPQSHGALLCNMQGHGRTGAIQDNHNGVLQRRYGEVMNIVHFCNVAFIKNLFKHTLVFNNVIRALCWCMTSPMKSPSTTSRIGLET